jgi:small subunit ribosomal protein S19e
MTTVYDVPADRLIQRIAEKLKSNEKIKAPEWAEYIKTGVHKEKAPVEREWWHKRVAAILRKIYIKGPIGTSRLAAEFGGKVDRGSKPYKARKGSRSIARHSLRQLEAAGLIFNKNRKGRVISTDGQKLLDQTAHEVLVELVKEDSSMAKYA